MVDRKTTILAKDYDCPNDISFLLLRNAFFYSSNFLVGIYYSTDAMNI